jgi:GNAT superfamily N-acetyltransferase
MDVIIRRLAAGDRPAAALLLDQTVGAGFWGFCEGPGDLSAVALRGDDLAGVVVAALEPASGEDAELAFGPAAEAAPGSSLLHVRAIAVAPEARRAGIARRLLSRVEEQAAEAGAAAAYLFAWLPAGQPEPAAVPFYLAAGYAPRPDIPEFYAPGSVATGAECPFCGAPPCRCAARPYVKEFAAGSGGA